MEADYRMLYDISPSVGPGFPVWPGDSPPAREVLLDMRRGDNLTLSTLRTTVHLGAHADAPSHYGADAPAIDERPLELYLGPCQVVHLNVPRGHRFREADVPVPITEPRVLFRTDSFDEQTFNHDFSAFDPALIDALHGRGVVLVGLDTPSVDLFDSKDLPAHQRLLAHDMAVLEGLVLEGVPPGRYELIALPLKLAGFDASPVRAVLRSLS
jgi:arylformamidase